MENKLPITMKNYDRSFMPTSVTLPTNPGGYLLTAEFTEQGKDKPIISRRYIKVGEPEEYRFFELPADILKSKN